MMSIMLHMLTNDSNTSSTGKFSRTGQTLPKTKAPRSRVSDYVFFFITCTSLIFYVIWLLLFTTPDSHIAKHNVVKVALQNQDSRLSEIQIQNANNLLVTTVTGRRTRSVKNKKIIYRKQKRKKNKLSNRKQKKNKLPKRLKSILLWRRQSLDPSNYFENGQQAFIKYNCSVKNCYVTSDRNFFDGDVTKFDAIAFNGRFLSHNDLPKQRIPWQNYIFRNMESAEYYPVCHPVFDNFFNWTATYKLNSDIPFTYLTISRNGQIVGPSVNMNWQAEPPVVAEDFENKLSNKSKAVAWFVSHCHTRSNREDVVSKLWKALSHYGYNIDAYGLCGPLKCPKSISEVCYEKLTRDYYFYLSMENSFAEDYVTEKLLTALQNDVVPIVYGGADYSRFLPQNSYLDAKKTSAPNLASIMDQLMNSPSLYAQYFRWKPFYQYSNPSPRKNVCKACAALNDKEMFRKKTVYRNFRKWWQPQFWKQC